MGEVKEFKSTARKLFEETADHYIADDEVYNRVMKHVNQSHPHLKEFKIAVLMTKKVLKSKGQVVGGRAYKLSEADRIISGYDLKVVFSEPVWDKVFETSGEKGIDALVEHELCHFLTDRFDGSTKIKPHDFEEFNYIVEKYGFWNANLKNLEQTFRQMGLPFEED